MARARISWFAILLIGLGTLLLLNRMSYIDVKFSTVFWPFVMAGGLLSVGRGLSRRRRGRVFWGTVMFLYGVFFFLRAIEALEIRSHMLVPATFIIAGIGFFMMYLSDLRDWFLLFPAVLLAGAGAALIAAHAGYLSAWEVWDVVHHYWPVILILIGLGIMLRRRPHPPVEAGTQPGPPPVV